MTCHKCSGLLRLDGYGLDLSAVCTSCGARWYAPLVPHVMSTARLAQASYCANCGMERALNNHTLGSKCLGARIAQGLNTARKNKARIAQAKEAQS